MIIDVSAGIGRWPFRRLRHADAGSLSALFQKKDVDRAIVYPVAAILAKDCMEGNHEVAEAVFEDPIASDRVSSPFVPFAVVNPAFPGWERDFETCIGGMGFEGLRLFPTYHGYGLGDAAFREIVAAAVEKEIPVVLSVRVEDERQHHWLVKVPPLDMRAVADAIGAFPRARFVVSGATYAELLPVKDVLAELDPWWFDIARMQGRQAHPGPVEVVERAVADFGVQRILFGSNVPFQYLDSSLLKVRHAPVSQADRERILSGNALRMLAGAREG